MMKPLGFFSRLVACQPGEENRELSFICRSPELPWLNFLIDLITFQDRKAVSIVFDICKNCREGKKGRRLRLEK